MLWAILAAVLVVGAVVIWQAVNYGRLKRYQRDSLIVFGKKGHGKSLLFSVMARQCRKKGYLSNTDFKHKGQILVKPSDISLSPNDWESVMHSEVVPVPRHYEWECKPVFFDDAGIYFPNFADNTLKKAYPSFPISLAVWRHLYDAPIHVNSQDVSRTWKMIREQADGFIKARRFFHLGPVGFLSLTYYDRVASAENDLAPLRKVFLNKYSSADVASYRAEHGEIKDFTLMVWLPHHRYDSRYFRGVFFRGEALPSEPTEGERASFS